MRDRPTVREVGPTRALAIAPLRAAPAGGGEAAGGGARGGRRGRALPGTARAEGERKKINPQLKLELPPPPPPPCGAPPRG